MLPAHSSVPGVLANADFRRIWSIGWLTAFCRWLEIIGTSIFVYEMTRSPQLVALLGVVRMVPYVTLGLAFGGLADAFERTTLLKLGLAAMLAMCLVMASLTGLGTAGYGVILAATLVSGTFWTIDMPVRRRLMVDTIGTDRMASGLGIDNASMHAARMVGPIAGGLLYEYAGISGIFLVAALIHAVCLMLAYAVSPAGNAFSSGRLNFSTLIPPRELFAERRFCVAMGVTVAYNLWCFPFTNMIPVIAQNDFALAPRWVGALTAVDGIGGIVGALVIAMVVKERTLFHFYFSGTLAVVLLYAALSLHLTLTVAVPVLLLIGIASAAFSATQYGLVYTLAPPELRGHATGVMQFFIGTSIIGHWLTGLLFERLGTVAALQVMAAQASVCLAILWVFWRRATRPT